MSKRVQSQLLKVYRQASETELTSGLTWYHTAHERAYTLAQKFCVSLPRVAGIVAALSPGREWERNVKDADEVLAALRGGRPMPTVGTYGRPNREKAAAIFRGENPLDLFNSGRYFKTKNFYLNILEPENPTPVTIDRHAYCAAYGIDSQVEQALSTGIRGGLYNQLAEEYRTAAAKVGVRPNQFQAVVWVTWKRLKAEEPPF